MRHSTHTFARPTSLRGGLVIVIALLVYAVVSPAPAAAHATKRVVALDYEARLSATAGLAPGVRARVVDGNRQLELTVDPGRTVVVRGYAGEAFLRFSRRGVLVNAASPTAVADKLAPPGAVPSLRPNMRPRWEQLTSGHSLSWHDHRLGPRPASDENAGRVGAWSVPILVDGKNATIEGGLWRASKPALWPWIVLWALAFAAAATSLRLISRHLRRRLVSLGVVLSAGVTLFVSAGFAASSGRAGWSRWLDLAVPAVLAASALLVVLLGTRHLTSGAACIAGFASASALQNLPVFVHGFVISSLPAAIARAGVALALAAGVFTLVLALAELWRGTPYEAARPAPRPQPRMAIPRGRAR